MTTVAIDIQPQFRFREAERCQGGSFASRLQAAVC